MPYSEPLSAGPSFFKPFNPKTMFPESSYKTEETRIEQAPENLPSVNKILVDHSLLAEFNKIKTDLETKTRVIRYMRGFCSIWTQEVERL